MERCSSIDYIKGCLILTVIVGHILLGSLDANIIRYVIYTFHMPAFIFMSGYLLNIEKIGQLCIDQLFVKYWHRMLLPWIIAWLVYTAIDVYGKLSLDAVLNNVINPFYHLWYIPSLFMMITIVWIAFRHFNSEKTITLLLLFLVGILLFNLSNTSYSIGSAWNCRMLPFFILGIASRRLLTNISKSGGGNFYIHFFSSCSKSQVNDRGNCLVFSYLHHVTTCCILMHFRAIADDSQYVAAQ